MRLILRLLAVFIACLLLVSAARAQEATPVVEPTLSPEEVLAVEVAQNAAEARRFMEESARYAEDASRFLGIFEAISVAIAFAAGSLGVVGVTRLFSAQNELVKARERVDAELSELRTRFQTELTEKEDALQQMSSTLLQSLEAQRKATEQATLALSLLPLGERQYRAQDLQGAADTYMRALKLDEDNPLIHYRVGYVYVQSGQLEDAERHLQAALSIDPDFHLAMAALGYVYRRQGDKLPQGIDKDELLNKAESYLLKALRLSPKLVDDDSESWWGSLGGLYRRRGQLDQAIHAYEQAAKVTPHSSYPFSNLAMLYMEKHSRDQMLNTFRRVERLARGEVQAEVDNYWAYADLLTSRLALGNVEGAEDALVSVFDLASSSSPYALEALADTLKRLLDALGGPEAAPHLPPYIERIQERIGDMTMLRLKST